MSAPFVGRQRELEVAAGLVRRALRERAPAFALIRGDPGSGKSRLLAEIAAASRSTRLVRVVGFEPMQRIPLAATGELLRLLADVPEHGAALESLVFAGGPDQDPIRVFEAAHRAITQVAPVLVAVDDLQWVDERSLAMIHYLLRSAETAHQALVVFATTRPSSAGLTLGDSLDPVMPESRRAFLELAPLAVGDGMELVRAIRPGLGDDAGEQLWRRAGGSPFWLEALAKSGEQGDPVRVLDLRLRALDSDSGELLAALAVAGRPLTAAEAAAVMLWEPARSHYAARDLVGHGLAVEAAGAVRLAHDLIREAALDTLPPSARRTLHARLAERIEATAEGDPQSLYEALEHRVAGGLPPADLALQLVTSPRRRLLGAGAIGLLASIRDTLERGTPQRISLDRGLAELGAALGDQQLAMDGWAEVARDSADAQDRQHAAIEAARAAYRLRRPAEAHAYLDRARAPLPPTGVTSIVVDALEAEVLLWLDHDTASGARIAERALAGASAMTAEHGGVDELSPEQRRASLAAHQAAFDAALQQERAEDAFQLSEACLSVARGLDDESHLTSLARTAFGLRPLGRVLEAEARYRQAWDLADRLILPTAMVEAGHGLARSLRDMGRLHEARAVAVRTVELESRMGHPPHRWGNAPAILHAIEVALGIPRALDELRRDARTEADPHYRWSVHYAIAAWQARLHGPRLAVEILAELAAARAATDEAGCPRCSGELTVSAAEVLARVGRVEESRAQLALSEAQGAADYLLRRVWHMRARAAIALASGDPELAATLLGELAHELDSNGLLEELLWARLDLGRALESIDRLRAIEAYSAAAALAGQTGAVAQGRVATQGLRRLGVRAWRRGRASGGAGLTSLSDREREIARLVAEGGSNREIADALLVSHRTVERHLGNVLAKLGLRNRTELASVMHSGLVRGSPDD